METVMEMRGVRRSFNGKEALAGVDFAVEKGEIFGLLGPSGAGKTTIVRILTGQLAPSSGTASLLGTNTTKLGDAQYARVGMVMDSRGVYPRLSVADNMRLFAQVYGVPEGYIAEALAAVGLADALKKPAGKLSKGMLQRLVLARAILHRPAALFLDEPTSGLDPATARQIHALLRAQQQAGCTILLTTHNMEEAASLCHRVALLNDGRIVESGPPAALCRKHNQDNTLHLLLKDGNTVTLPSGPAAAAPLAEYLRGDKLESIHSSEPNLESVFIALTGRKLA